jgi:hypothetical protein
MNEEEKLITMSAWPLVRILREATWMRMTRADQEAYAGVEGNGFIADLPDGIVAIMDSTPAVIVIELYDEEGSLFTSWELPQIGETI